MSRPCDYGNCDPQRCTDDTCTESDWDIDIKHIAVRGRFRGPVQQQTFNKGGNDAVEM